MKVKSFIRWAGSKRGVLLPLSKLYYATEASRYIEPFCGSASLFFHLSPPTAVLADSNELLANTLEQVRSNCRDVVKAIKSYDCSSEAYYRIRSLDHTRMSKSRRAAWFIYLNRLCFNGLFRTNRRGQFNVPYGARTGDLPTVNELQACSEKLQNSKVLHADFRETLAKPRTGDFIYIDPPYPNLTRPTYGEYGYGAFTKEDLPDLCEMLLRADKIGAQIAFSYHSSKELQRFLPKRWTIIRYFVRRKIGGSIERRKKRVEIIATNISVDLEALKCELG